MIALLLVVAGAAPDAWTVPAQGDASGVFVAAQVISGIDATVAATEPQTVFPSFRLDRADVGGGFVYEGVAGALVRFETIRSAAPQSAFGIDGDSLLPRLKLGYGVFRPRFDVGGVSVVVDARAGLVPSPWLSRLEPHLGSRGLAPLGAEARGLFGSSDLGAVVNVVVFDLVDVGISLENGEGKNEVERNAGKNLTAVIGVSHAVARFFDGDVVVGGVVAWRDGSVGAGSARDHRAAAAVFVDHDRAHVVVEGVYGFGYDGRAEQEPGLVDVAADVDLWPHLIGMSARWQMFSADTHVGDAASQSATAALFTDFGLDLNDSTVLRRLRLFAGVSGDVVGKGAGPFVGVPAAGESLRVFASLEVNGATDIVDPFSHRVSAP